MTINSVNNYTYCTASSFAAADLKAAPSPEQNEAFVPADSFSVSSENLECGNTELPAVHSEKPKAAAQMSDRQIDDMLSGILKDDMPSSDNPICLSLEEGCAGVGLCSSEACCEGLPDADTVKDYKYISHSDACADYVQNVRGNLNIAEKGCIKAYCTVAYKLMNGYLLGLNGSPTGTVRRAAKCMTKALNKFDVPSESILYRTSNINELRNYLPAEKFAEYERYCRTPEGTALAAKALNAELQGTQTVRKSFLSTTIDPDFNFEDKPKVAANLYVGDNVKGVYVGAELAPENVRDEKEFLLAPDTKVTVMGVEYSEKNKGLVLNLFLGDIPEKR